VDAQRRGACDEPPGDREHCGRRRQRGHRRHADEAGRQNPEDGGVPGDAAGRGRQDRERAGQRPEGERRRGAGQAGRRCAEHQRDELRRKQRNLQPVQIEAAAHRRRERTQRDGGRADGADRDDAARPAPSRAEHRRERIAEHNAGRREHAHADKTRKAGPGVVARRQPHRYGDQGLRHRQETRAGEAEHRRRQEPDADERCVAEAPLRTETRDDAQRERAGADTLR
jgi:hypothetical protein